MQRKVGRLFANADFAVYPIVDGKRQGNDIDVWSGKNYPVADNDRSEETLYVAVLPRQ